MLSAENPASEPWEATEKWKVERRKSLEGSILRAVEGVEDSQAVSRRSHCGSCILLGEGRPKVEWGIPQGLQRHEQVLSLGRV